MPSTIFSGTLSPSERLRMRGLQWPSDGPCKMSASILLQRRGLGGGRYWQACGRAASQPRRWWCVRPPCIAPPPQASAEPPLNPSTQARRFLVMFQLSLAEDTSQHAMWLLAWLKPWHAGFGSRDAGLITVLLSSCVWFYVLSCCRRRTRSRLGLGLGRWDC